MASSIPEALREILAEQYDADQLDKVLAQAFNYGVSVVFHPDGSRKILPEFTIEMGINPPSDDGLTAIETPPDDWDRLLRQPPKETEIAVFSGNFRRGVQGKHDETTWRKDDLTTEDARTRRGYTVTGGHRGGMRQANSPAALKVLFRRTPPRKYR